jgi:chromate transporter
LVGPLSGQPLLTEIGIFFSQLAVVTFGGAYAVLAYMAQDVVTQQGWLTAGQMMDGLGLAETTPGPLILVTQFVGFMAGHGQGGLGLAFAAGLVTLWATFLPCFLWIFAGAPYIAWIGGQPRLQGALAGITAAVVGVILNLSLWFGLHVVFAEVSRIGAGPLGLWWPTGAIDLTIVALSLLSGVLLLRLHLPLGWVLAAAGTGGWALSLLG